MPLDIAADVVDEFNTDGAAGTTSVASIDGTEPSLVPLIRSFMLFEGGRCARLGTLEEGLFSIKGIAWVGPPFVGLSTTSQ
jgi:hypothetical protein